MIPIIKSGMTPAGNTNWKLHPSKSTNPTGLVVVISPLKGFKTTPEYISQLEGDNIGNVTGGSAIYEASKTGFAVYVRPPSGVPVTREYANQNKWRIYWTAVENVLTKGLYVDGLYDEAILGNESKENTLLDYAKKKGFNYLILYEIYPVLTRLSLEDEEKNKSLPDNQKIKYTAAYAAAVKTKLAAFIKKAKTQYGILRVAAAGENSSFFRDRIIDYNNTTEESEQIDTCNIEFEYWNEKRTDDNKYYCNTYLKPAKLACNRNGAFEFYRRIQGVIQEIALMSERKMFVDVYLGNFLENEVPVISGLTGDVLIADYTVLDNIYPRIKDRLSYFRNCETPASIIPIFSAEKGEQDGEEYAYFMEAELLAGMSLDAPYKKIVAELAKETGNWKTKISLGGYVWFKYSILRNVSP